MKRTLIILSSAIVLFTSCSNTPPPPVGDLNKYRHIRLETAPVKPSSKKMTVVIFNLDDRFNKISKESRLGFAMSNELKSKLVQTKHVEVIRRDIISSDLPEEIRRYLGDEFSSAQYLLMGKITEAKYKNRFYHEERNADGSVSLPSWISYGACIRGNINLIKLPSMIMRESFDFDECSEEIDSAISPRDMKESNPDILRTNIEDILKDIVPKMKKYFRPEGYVREMLTNDKQKIIETTLSSNLGAVEGTKVEIFRLLKRHDKVKNKSYIRPRKIGEGRVSDMITSEQSFIIIDNLQETLKIGDVVRVAK
jgi:hypothetical protein